MSFGKRGQGAIEYLMSHAWAIIVIMLVGIVLHQMGIFNTRGEITKYEGFSKIKGLATETSVSTGGSSAYNIQLQSTWINTVYKYYRITSVTVTNTGEGLTCTDVSYSPSNVADGAPFKISAAGCTNKPVGERVKLEVVITGTQRIGNVEQVTTDSGSLITFVEG
jgi:hypothetical protein